MPGQQIAERGIEPVAARLAFLGGDDLDPLAIFQRGVERNHHAIDLGAATAMPQVGVQRVGEIHRRGAAVERDHPALRGQHIDLILEQLGLELLGEFAAVGNVVLPFQNAPQPGDLFLVLRVLLAAFLVAPMRGDAEFGMRCMSKVRICTSSARSSGPITAVCSER